MTPRYAIASNQTNTGKWYITISVGALDNGGTGGFFLACEVFGKMFDLSFPAYDSIFLFFKRRLARAHQFHSFCQDQSTMA